MQDVHTKSSATFFRNTYPVCKSAENELSARTHAHTHTFLHPVPCLYVQTSQNGTKESICSLEMMT